jgi:UDP-N-acetylglucosamine:LPS N-acetylglucosamine transferase
MESRDRLQEMRAKLKNSAIGNGAELLADIVEKSAAE